MPEVQSDSGGDPQGNASVKGTGSGWLPNWMTSGKAVDPTKKPVISNAEVFALLEYTASHGIEKEKVEALSREIHAPEPDPSTVASLYADLVSMTTPISGRTLIDSRESGTKRLFGISVATTIFFILAIGNQIADSWVADIVEPEEGLFWSNVLKVKTYAWDYLAPFFWGALGSCIYLLKAVQDAARENVYEHHWMQGWGTRVLIGGILAAIVLIIFDPSTLTPEALPLRPAAVAFLIGLGVKAVYGALEKTIETLSDKLNLKSIRRVPAPKGDDGA